MGRGILKVKVVNGRGLKNKELLTKSDPYCMIEVGEEKFKTSSKPNSLNPDWDEDFTFNDAAGFDFLTLTVWDKNSLSKDDFMGYAFVSIDQCLQGQKNTKAVQIMGGMTGELNVELFPEFKTCGSMLLELGEQNAKFEENNKILEKSIGTLQEENKVFESNNKKLEAENAKFSENNARLEENVLQLTGENEKFASSNIKLENEINRLSEELSKLSEENNKFAENNEALKAQVSLLNVEVTKLSGENEKFSNNNQKFNALVKFMAGENHIFEENNKKLQAEIEKLQVEVERMTQENNRFAENNRNLQQQVNKFKEVHEKLKEENEKLAAVRDSFEQLQKMIFDQMQQNMKAMDRSLLEKIAADIEMLDKNQGLSQDEFNKFLKRVPTHLRGDFKQVAFDKFDENQDSVIDSDEFGAMLDEVMKKNVEE